MRLHLVDIEPKLVDCWVETFAPFPEVEILHDNILHAAQNTIVSPANSYGLMDGGIDQLYIEYFGVDLQQRVYDAVGKRPEGYLPVGASLLVKTSNERIPHMIVAPTMLLPEPVPPAHAFHAMMAVLRIAKQNSGKIRDVYCPGLATGTGRVAFDDAACEMAAAYRRWINQEGPLDSY